MDRPAGTESQTRLALAVNYSPQAATLVQTGQIDADRFKCPAWPDTIEIARQTLPVYVHLPLAVGSGAGFAIDAETRRPADFDHVERILDETDTRLVNLHIASPADRAADPDGFTPQGVRPDSAAQRLSRDVASAVHRFGAERVVLENDYECIGDHVDPVLRPETMHEVLDETGAGLLLDLSHALLAARHLGVDTRAYIEALPMDRMREMHVSGVQPLEGRWSHRLRRGGVQDTAIRDYLLRTVDGLSDHLPMTADDWALTSWAVGRVRSGAWPRPWIVAYEYGGIGGWFGPVTDTETLARQVHRLGRILVEGRAGTRT